MPTHPALQHSFRARMGAQDFPALLQDEPLAGPGRGRESPGGNVDYVQTRK
jgi:hypothetical protein